MVHKIQWKHLKIAIVLGRTSLLILGKIIYLLGLKENKLTFLFLGNKLASHLHLKEKTFVFRLQLVNCWFKLCFVWVYLSVLAKWRKRKFLLL